MNIIVFVIALLFGGGFWAMRGETFTSIVPSGAGIGAIPLPLVVAFATAGVFVLGGYMSLKRKKYARIVLWVSFVLCIAAYALDPNGLIFTGDDKNGIDPDSVLALAFIILLDAMLAHFDYYRQKIKQLQDSKAQEV